jgi:hypothetical protein
MRLTNADFKFARATRLCKYQDDKGAVQYWLVWQLVKVTTGIRISLGF